MTNYKELKSSSQVKIGQEKMSADEEGEMGY